MRSAALIPNMTSNASTIFCSGQATSLLTIVNNNSKIYNKFKLT